VEKQKGGGLLQREVADPVADLRERTHGVRVEDRRQPHDQPAAEARDKESNDDAGEPSPGDIAKYLAGRRGRRSPLERHRRSYGHE
jgi:hypothetical protein